MNVFIGCSSSEKINKKYLELTKEIASYLVSMDYNLVFGACSKSMMGICYYKFINNGKGVTSVTPDVYEDDLKNLEESRQIITSNTITRFETIYELSNLIVILPGGIGTLAELCSTIEEIRTIDNNKEVILVNYDGFYDEIINWIKKGKKLGFVSLELDSIISIVENFDDFKEKVGGIEWKK